MMTPRSTTAAVMPILPSATWREGGAGTSTAGVGRGEDGRLTARVYLGAWLYAVDNSPGKGFVGYI